MSIRACLGALALALVLPGQAAAASPGAAGVPPPPPTPVCKYCSGPPLPPTPVPVLPATVSPPAVVVVVHLSPIHVRRGHIVKLSISAATDDLVMAVVRYHRGKTVTYRGKIDSAGTYTKSLKIPNDAPLGQATLSVRVGSGPNPYAGTLSFVVLK